MKKLTTMLVLFAGLLFLVGCGNSDSSANDRPGGEEGVENPTLMEALKSSEAENLAGEDGVHVIFVQSRDGTTMMNDVEALDTLYLLSGAGATQTHIYETDKSINIIDDRIVDDVWLGGVPYNPANLPDIDFDSAYESVKAVSGDKPIANISIRYNDSLGEPLIVAFTLQGATEGACDEYDYPVETGEVNLAAYGIACFFDINYGSGN